MISPTALEVLFVGIAIALAALIVARPELTRVRGGKILAFVTLFVLPVLGGWLGFSEHMERAESTRFCLS